MIDAAPEKLRKVMDRSHRAANDYQRSRMSVAGGMFVLVLFVILLYVVLNQISKGYFTWPLRATTILLILVVVVLSRWIFFT